MAPLSYRRHRFPPEIIQHAIWLYLCFTLSYRDVEELLAERELDVSYETVRRWVLKFGSRLVPPCSCPERGGSSARMRPPAGRLVRETGRVAPVPRRKAPAAQRRLQKQDGSTGLSSSNRSFGLTLSAIWKGVVVARASPGGQAAQ